MTFVSLTVPRQTSHVKDDAALPQAYPALVLKPLTAYSTLSACLTPKNP